MTSTIEKKVKKNGVSGKIGFEFFAPESKKVEVAGSFSDWKPLSLKKMSEGKWIASLDLKPGKYEYRYLVDEIWQNDQRPCECVPNNFGTWNCVAEVK